MGGWAQQYGRLEKTSLAGMGPRRAEIGSLNQKQEACTVAEDEGVWRGRACNLRATGMALRKSTARPHFIGRPRSKPTRAPRMERRQVVVTFSFMYERTQSIVSCLRREPARSCRVAFHVTVEWAQAKFLAARVEVELQSFSKGSARCSSIRSVSEHAADLCEAISCMSSLQP